MRWEEGEGKAWKGACVLSSRARNNNVGCLPVAIPLKSNLPPMPTSLHPCRPSTWNLLCALALSLSLLAVIPSPGAAIDELATFSGFEKVDLHRLADGEILANSETAMGDSRDIFVETCFLVRAPAESAAGTLQTWNPADHAPLGVLLHQPIQSPPQEADFQALKLDGSQPFVRWFLTKTLATSREKSDLYLSREEAATIVAALEPLVPDARQIAVPAIWKSLLLKRAAAFDRGGLAGLPPYFRGGVQLSPLGEAERLLKQEPEVAARFNTLLKETRLTPSLPGPRPMARAYWELSKVTDHATLGIGTIFVHREGDTFQVLDCQHYSSGSLYVSLVLSQLWPVVVDGKPMTLFWRGDFLSSPSLTGTRGTERMACGAIMVQEIKKAVRFFREDAEKVAK